MKKFLLIIACCMIGMSASAQKTTVTTTTAHRETTYQYTQARKPQVWVEPLVKPLVVEVEIMKEQPTFWKTTLPKYKVEDDLDGKIENVYNYGIFLYTDATNSDMIVAATYNFYTNPKRTNEEDWYVLEIKGFPAKFKEWHTATTADYEWMKIKYLYSDNKTNKDVFEKVSENK